MAATGHAQGKSKLLQYTSVTTAQTFSDPSTLPDWAHIVGAGSTILVNEDASSVTITTDAAEPVTVAIGPFTGFTSTTATRVRMGNGKPPTLTVVVVDPSTTVADYTAGTALTDTATTTVQRAAKRTSFLLAGTMSQGETITLGTTGALQGDQIKIIRTSTSAQTATIVNGGGGAGTLVVMAASKKNFFVATFDGTNWLFDMIGLQ